MRDVPRSSKRERKRERERERWRSVSVNIGSHRTGKNSPEGRVTPRENGRGG